MENNLSVVSPVKDRIVSLDVLRGFALLGILTMNIVIFALPFMFYGSPNASGTALEGIEKWVFSFNYIFCNLKFMSIFSILFGAGVVLFTEKAAKKSDVNKARELHYIRNFWLLIFGLLHAYLIWYGDILVMYAICSTWVYLFRKKTPKSLLIWAVLLMIFNAILFFGFHQLIELSPPEAKEQMYADEMFSAEGIAKEIEIYKGGWLNQMEHRATISMYMQMMILFFGWQTTGLMLVGMALYKLDILTAKKSISFYIKMLIIGLICGLTLSAIGIFLNETNEWDYIYTAFVGQIYTNFSGLFMALAYIAIIMLLCKSRFKQILFNWLAPVGKMALTNYLMQSLIATFIFYGHGLGLFGNYGRAELYLFVFGIWIFQIIFSHYWMRYFQFGPFEWLWRSLTYWKLQPMRK